MMYIRHIAAIGIKHESKLVESLSRLNLMKNMQKHTTSY